jgi:cold shock CspA family protein
VRAIGHVVSFDDPRGVGEVETADGRRLFFHCTAIADGTRTIPAGVAVEFDVIAGPTGRSEASSIRRVATP